MPAPCHAAPSHLPFDHSCIPYAVQPCALARSLAPSNCACCCSHAGISRLTCLRLGSVGAVRGRQGCTPRLPVSLSPNCLRELTLGFAGWGQTGECGAACRDLLLEALAQCGPALTSLETVGASSYLMTGTLASAAAVGHLVGLQKLCCHEVGRGRRPKRGVGGGEGGAADVNAGSQGWRAQGTADGTVCCAVWPWQVWPPGRGQHAMST